MFPSAFSTLMTVFFTLINFCAYRAFLIEMMRQTVRMISQDWNITSRVLNHLGLKFSKFLKRIGKTTPITAKRVVKVIITMLMKTMTLFL